MVETSPRTGESFPRFPIIEFINNQEKGIKKIHIKQFDCSSGGHGEIWPRRQWLRFADSRWWGDTILRLIAWLLDSNSHFHPLLLVHRHRLEQIRHLRLYVGLDTSDLHSFGKGTEFGDIIDKSHDFWSLMRAWEVAGNIACHLLQCLCIRLLHWR